MAWRNWASFVGPGIVMMGIQIGGGEWLLGPEITARYGGGLMWVATIAIVLQVFYNIECGRYALYCGEPVFTGFMRVRPGPALWMSLMLLLNASALIPALSTNGAAIIASLWLNRPAGPEDRLLVTVLAYACLIGVALPVLVGGKIYNMLQAVMTAKVLF
ncbi:MAG: Nramp family divalent metal transporter, partial [Phycisphaerae bacterium]